MKHRLLLVALPALRALAHDMWIEPTTFRPQPGQVVGAKLRVGQELLGDPIGRDPELIQQFVFEDAAGRKPLIGRDGADPAGFLRAAAPGLIVIGYRSNPSVAEQKPAKFNDYLKEEGLEHIAGARAAGDGTVRELFARCAKSLLAAGGSTGNARDRALGFTLELVAEADPYAAAELPVRLTFENKPLPGALVVAMNRANPAEKQTARTGADGRVRFKLKPAGMWMIKSVHMTPAPAASGARWMSYWASLTFARE